MYIKDPEKKSYASRFKRIIRTPEKVFLPGNRDKDSPRIMVTPEQGLHLNKDLEREKGSFDPIFVCVSSVIL